jgi:hypothetical protein
MNAVALSRVRGKRARPGGWRKEYCGVNRQRDLRTSREQGRGIIPPPGRKAMGKAVDLPLHLCLTPSGGFPISPCLIALLSFPIGSCSSYDGRAC